MGGGTLVEPDVGLGRVVGEVARPAVRPFEWERASRRLAGERWKGAAPGASWLSSSVGKIDFVGFPCEVRSGERFRLGQR
jgi:hypothetical protein